MTATVSQKQRRRITPAQRGQALIVALAVIFLLLVLGGVFISLIARNLTAAGRSRDTQISQSLAEAGINYCDDQLTNSLYGADWRPTPTSPLTSPSDPAGLTDPDYQWLSQGFTRLSFPTGRALVRVTYDPHPDDPRSQLIRIESIGRQGDLGQGLDPTVFVQNGNAPRLRREMIGYKQMGLPDYTLYVTNKDRRATEAFLGYPALTSSMPGLPNTGLDPALVIGDPSRMLHTDGVNNNELIIGGGIRVNGNLRIGGDVFMYMSPRGTVRNGNFNVSPEALLVSGNINLLPTRNLNNGGQPANAVLDDNDLQVFVNQFITDQNPGVGQAIRASSDPNFNTLSGLVRDGSPASDVNGFGRGVPRLDPPVWDARVSGTGVLRYRALSRDSGFKINGTFDTGQLGFGRGIYLNNPDDLQRETTTQGINGGYSLRADWVDPNNTFSNKRWDGPFYRPPGILVELLGNMIRFTRDDGRPFLKPNGQPINGANASASNVLEIPLADAARNVYQFPDGALYTTVVGRPMPLMDKDGDQPGPNSPFFDKSSYGVNVVIMAEGNLRIKGTYGAITDPTVLSELPYLTSPINRNLKLGRVHLTVVTGGTAYIEGNLIKGDGFVDSSGRVTLERGSTCAILAKDYVCVNPTMFMSPQNQTNVWSRPTPNIDAFFTEVGQSRPTIDMSFSNGIPYASYRAGTANSPIYMNVRHGAQTDNSGQGRTLLNLLVNPSQAGVVPPGQASPAFYPFNLSGLPPETYALTDTISQIAQSIESRTFDLLNTATGQPLVPTLNGYPGFANLLRFQLDTNAAALLGGSGSTDYLFGGAMVTPMDVRIEALIYAQEKSFFIIPGYSFNPDPNDTREQYVARGGIRPSYTTQEVENRRNGVVTPDMLAKDRFPFYNQPLDVRITVCGAIAQNNTATASDQASWLAKWGYVPLMYGASPQQIPDIHRNGHDAIVNSSQISVNYNPAEDKSGDYRTFLESNQRIARGLRIIYDPAFAMPYLRPTNQGIYASAITRQNNALRYRRVGNFVQTLPALPRLPVCPGLLYFGKPEQPIVP